MSSDPHMQPLAHESSTEAPTTLRAPRDVPVNREPEKALWAGRTDWRHFAGRYLLFLVVSLATLLIIPSLVPSVGWVISVVVIFAAAVLTFVKPLLMIVGTHYRITTERLFVTRGIISQTIDQTELIRVDDVRVRKLLVDRLFSLGSVQVLSTDFSDKALEIVGVANAENVAEMIRDQMRSARRRSLFVENL